MSPLNIEPRLLVRGLHISALLNTAIDLNLPLLVDGHLTSDEIARKECLNPPRLYALFQAMSAFGIFSVNKFGVVLHTDCSLQLLDGHPNSLAPSIRFWSTPALQDTWLSLSQSIRSNFVMLEQQTGLSFFDYLQSDADLRQRFESFMSSDADSRFSVIVSLFPSDLHGLLIDIGGGSGVLGRALIDRFSDLNVRVLDRVVDTSADMRRARIELLKFDFFADELPPADYYCLCQILHDWDDIASEALLRSIAAVMKSSSRLFIIEREMNPEDNIANALTQLSNIEMNLSHGSFERTASEYADLLLRCDLIVSKKSWNSNTPFFLIEASVQNNCPSH